MAFRIETRVGCIAMLALAAWGATPVTIEVRHRHLRKGADGTLTFEEHGMKFVEEGKRAAHSREWKYSDIERFDLAPEHIRVITYEDIRWQAGRDRVFLFDELPDGAAGSLYAMLESKLDQRFVADVATLAAGRVRWESPAKMLRLASGSNGTLRITEDRVVFEGDRGSRTWRIADVDNFSSAGPFELSLTSLDGETRFQLKQQLPEDRYNELWRLFSKAPGLKNFMTLQETHHD
ncbi:MAG: hypothetical protein JSU00_13115 [Acidobacteria bacterium]|nr:hypothetical protein [Acidobacteriota bacterium]